MLASVEQFKIRLGRDLMEGEEPRIEAILEDTSVLANSYSGEAWTPETVPADVAAIVLSAALRTFKNPDRYIQQAIGDFSARVADTELAAGVFTKAELDILDRNSANKGFQFGSFGTMGRTRDEVQPGRTRFWHSSIPGVSPYSEEVDW